MGGSTLVFERDIELPREIVWDALIDPDLVLGWLALAIIEPRVGGRYDLVWLHPEPFPPTRGQIRVITEPELIEVETSNAGLMKFELETLPGGPRGSSTRLRLTVGIDTEPAFSSRMKAYWLTDLDQLEDLLRGHPVDWANWDRDHLEAWEAYLEAANRGTA